MNIYNELLNKNKKLCVVGLGYVGMPIAIQFAKKIDVIGFDVNQKKINEYLNGIDPTNEVGNEEIKNTKMHFTCNESDLKNISTYIVAVPTPINLDKTPDLTPVISASEVVGRNIEKGTIVVYESTVYPGVTEDICIPIIEKISGLECGKDWWIGYSPERINPADKVHRLWNIKKIVSGIDKESCDEIAKIYELVVEVGVHKVSNIKTAEAIKVVENSQRDINIAFMNELAMVFDRMGIDTKEVVEGMNTKWNALGFMPGLVGGHCIGVDPYYFTYQAEKLGYHSQIILSGRKVNDDMGNPLVSIIIPTYKRTTFLLDRAIQSVLKQTYTNIELVVVDDNALDNLTEYRKANVEYINKLNSSNIKLILNKTNLGGALSRNEGIFSCEGNYVTFLDDDDEFKPTKIENQIQFMLENKLDVSFTDLTLYNEQKKVIDRREHNDITNFDTKYLFRYHLTKQITGTETFMIKKDVLKMCGGFDDAVMGHEFYLMAKILQLDNIKIGYFNSDDIIAYRTALESISNGPNKIIGENKVYQYKKSFFNDLSFNERNYIMVRHNAVLAVAYKRNKKYLRSFCRLLFAFLLNPILCIKEFFNLKKRKRNLKK